MLKEKKKTTEAKQLRSLIGIESHLQSMSGRVHFFAKAQHTDASWQHIAGRQQPEEEEEKKTACLSH